MPSTYFLFLLPQGSCLDSEIETTCEGWQRLRHFSLLSSAVLQGRRKEWDRHADPHRERERVIFLFKSYSSLSCSLINTFATALRVKSKILNVASEALSDGWSVCSASLPVSPFTSFPPVLYMPTLPDFFQFFRNAELFYAQGPHTFYLLCQKCSSLCDPSPCVTYN